jgi:ferredoxin, 2Fe-2S
MNGIEMSKTLTPRNRVEMLARHEAHETASDVKAVTRTVAPGIPQSMVHIIYIEPDGTRYETLAQPGSTVMQTAQDNAVPGIIAECCGMCACATCHVFVDPAWLDRVGTPDTAEIEVLKFAVAPRENSRLACQITVTHQLDGLTVHLPKTQYQDG